MGLGHALLHPGRLARALDADPDADTNGAVLDAGLGLFGFGDPGPAAAAWSEDLARRAQPFADLLGRAGQNAPFAAFMQELPADIPGLIGKLDGLVEAAAGLDADTLRRPLLDMLDGLLGGLPALRLPDLVGAVRGELEAALGILEAPLTGGRQDAAAHRAFRTAAEIRRRLLPLTEDLPTGFATLDVKAWLRERLAALLAGVDAAALAPIAAQLAAFKAEFGRLFDALGRVSVGVEVHAGGPQPMPGDVPGLADEAKATPFPRGHALWWLDLITGVVAVFNLIWEMARTGNFHGRGFDGFISVVLMLWQIARVAVRAAAPDTLAGWPSGTQWLFTDQGDFVLSVGARLLAAFYEVRAPTNWVASVLVRGLKHVTAVSQPRAVYQFARSLWYHLLWTDTAPRPPPSFLRSTWLLWGPMWGAAFLFALMPSWDDFHLEKTPASLLVPLIVGGLLALATFFYLVFGQLGGAAPAADDVSRGVLAGSLGLLVILVAVLLAGLESEDKGLAIGLFVLFAALVAAALALAWIPQTSGAFTSYLLIALSGVVAAYMIPFVLWWDYIDDGRDKPGAFDGLDADTSPYRLPYTSGENWMCSQGTHGIFSHHTVGGTSNHYAYDFNEVMGSTVRAVREGIVTEAVEAYENEKQDANYLHVLHWRWTAGHDPGTDDERVLTYNNYYHLMQGGVLPELGQFVQRGEDVARLDSTGRSAQQHIHTAAQEQQRGSVEGVPFVFGDADTKGFRHYPLLAWIKGKGPIPGKPVSYGYYVSENAAPAEAPAAMTLELALDAGGADDHLHRVVIPAAALAGAGDVVVQAVPQRGHSHSVTLTRAAIAALRGGGAWTAEGIAVAAAPDGHAHAALRWPVRKLWLKLGKAKSAAAGEHWHFVGIDLPAMLDGLPASAPVTSESDQGNVAASATNPHHVHDVAFTRAGLRALLRREVPAAAEVTVTAADGHGHALGETFPLPDETTLRGLTAAIVAPPRARLALTAPGPHRFWGSQWVLRANDRENKAWFFGAHRPQIAPDIAVERGLAPSEPVHVAGALLSPASDTRGSPRAAAAALTQALRAGGGAQQHAALSAVPVIVLETRRRGSGAALARLAGGADLFGPALASAGSGDLPDIGSFTPDALAARIQAGLQAGWPAPPAPASGAIAQAFETGGPPLDAAAGSARNAAVLLVAAAPADGKIASLTPLPLASGALGVTAGWSVPILVAPAVQRLDLTHAAMTGTQRQATPLLLVVCGTVQPVAFTPADATAEAVARRIMLQADGVRAWPAGADAVTIATIGGGAAVSLALSKDAGLALPAAAGVSAPLGGGGTVGDSGAVPVLQLRQVVADAVARAVLPYDPAAVLPTAAMVGGALRLQVAAGHLIGKAGEGLPLLPGAAAPGLTWLSDPLAGPLALAGTSWIDIDVDTARVRIALSGEPARLELGPLPRLPLAGEMLKLSLNGAPLDIVFDGSDGAVAAVAERIATASPDLSVRFAWRLVAGNTLHGDGAGPSPLQLRDSAGLNLIGMLRDRATLVGQAAGPRPDVLATGPDAPVDGGTPTTQPIGTGPRRLGLTVPAGAPARIVAASGESWAVTATPAGPDPLQLAAGPSSEILQIGVDLDDPAHPVALPGSVATWSFTVRQGGVDQAKTMAQLAAMPAALRATAPVATPGGALPLTVTVIAPDGERPAARVDLAGIADPDAAAARLAMVPGLAAFAVSLPLAGIVVVQMETLGRGTGWGLRLTGRDALLALGFRPPAYDPAADTLETTGGGTLRDGARITADEARALLERARDAAVGPLATPPPLYAVVAAGAGVLLAPGSGGGPVPALASEPAGYRNTLAATAGPGGLTIPGPRTRPLGALLLVSAGPQRTTVPLLGEPAELRAPDPVPADGTPEATAMLAALQSGGLTVTVDGSAHAVPAAPAPFADLDAAVEWIAAAIQPGWAGLVADAAAPAARHLVLRSGRRGSLAGLALSLPAGAPAGGLLGFAASANAAGAGTVGDADDLLVAGGAGTLQDALAARASIADAPQALYQASAEGPGAIRLRPNGTARLDLPGATVLGMPAALDGATLVLTSGPARALTTAAIRLTLRPAIGDPVRIGAAIWGAPARLPAMSLPTNLPALDGKTLELTVGTQPVSIAFAAPITPARLAARIARGSGWTLRGMVEAGGLVIETRQQGSAAQLVLRGGTALAGAVADRLGTPAAMAASGAGSVPDLAAATAADIAAALQAGWAEMSGGSDQVDMTDQKIDRRVYAPDAAAGRAWVLASGRAGVAGRLERLAAVAGPGEPGVDDSLGRGAAIRAAVALPLSALPATRAPSGALVIRLDDNAGPGLTPRRDVTVSFDGAALTAPQIAGRIDAALRAASAGAAAAWPDGTVVIETATPGLAGSLEVPAADPPRGAADALLGPGVTLRGRGWPGAGAVAPGAALPTGWRAARASAAAAASYVFKADGRGTAAIPIPAGMDAAAAVRAVNAAFDATATAGQPRLGLAALHEGALCIEALVTPMQLLVDGTLAVATTPAKAGDTPEPPADAAFDLRRTDLIRTVRLVRAASDDPDFAGAADFGWLRHPMRQTQPSGTPPPDPFLQTASFPSFPVGRWLVAARPDAARAGNAADPGALRAAVAMAPLARPTGSGARAEPLILRYWVSLRGGGGESALLGAGSAGPEPFMADLLTWR